MKAEFICHKDFESQIPINIFHKEKDRKDLKEKDSSFINRHILFRKKFEISDFKSATLRITADDFYKLYINGAFVTQGPRSSYHTAYNYNEIDVSKYLKCGENVIAVHTYYQGLINHYFFSCDRRQSLFFELTLDEKTVLVSDESWKCKNHTGYTEKSRHGNETAVAEIYDSGCTEDKFFEADFDDSEWEYARIFKNADYNLVKQKTTQQDIYPIYPKIKKNTDYGLWLDFGREAVGYLCATAEGAKGDKVVMRFGEELLDNGRVRYDLRCNCVYEEDWILSGKKDTLNQFDYKGFRYVELFIPEGVNVTDVHMRVCHYPYEEKAEFNTDNPEILEILRLCADTIKYGTLDKYVDCPTREKGQYLGDVAISGRAHAILTKDTTFLKSSIRDFCNSSIVCEGLLAVACSSLMQEIADYSLLLPSISAWVYKFDGDVEFLRETEPYLTGIFRYFRRFMGEDGLLYGCVEKWNLVDWPENLRDGYEFPPDEDAHNVLNAFWCGFLDSLDSIYSILGMHPLNLSEKIKDSFIKAFYSEKIGLFCDNKSKSHAAIHSNILPLLYDIGTNDKSLVSRIVSLLMDKRLSSMGVYISYFALVALKRHGFDSLCDKLVTDEGCWKRMLREGATTTFEAWGKDEKSNCSLFHPWATAPIIIYAKDIDIY